MTPNDLNPTQKTLLIQALQSVVDRHKQQGNETFIVDLLLSPKETQEAIIKELAAVVANSLTQNITQMQQIIAMKPPEIPPMTPVATPPVPPPAG